MVPKDSGPGLNATSAPTMSCRRNKRERKGTGGTGALKRNGRELAWATCSSAPQFVVAFGTAIVVAELRATIRSLYERGPTEVSGHPSTSEAEQSDRSLLSTPFRTRLGAMETGHPSVSEAEEGTTSMSFMSTKPSREAGVLQLQRAAGDGESQIQRQW